MNVGSLFSGIGGFDLGLERAGMQVRWQVENNEFCNRVLAKHWPGVQRYGDIKAVDWQAVETVDLVCGGFPCQPFSCAGKRRGQDDDRYLWPEVVRCLDTLRPTWFLGENVPGLINLALDQVCTDLESLGYTVWPVCVPACAVDAPHQRQRIWILAHAKRNGSGPRRAECEGFERTIASVGNSGDVAHASSAGGRNGDQSESKRAQAAQGGAPVADAESIEERGARETQGGQQEQVGGRGSQPSKDVRHGQSERSSRWPTEPDVGGSSDGLPDWLDRHIGKGMSYAESQRAIKTLRALWKPHVAAAIWEAAGGLDRISQAEVLFAVVREYKKDAHQTRLLLASQEALKTFVRGVWRATADASSSRRSRQDKQRSIEHSDAMQMVPRFHPRDGETPWPACGWEDGIARVAHGVENRVDRLRGLGNAIVPAIAEVLGKMILAAVADDEDYSDLL